MTLPRPAAAPDDRPPGRTAHPTDLTDAHAVVVAIEAYTDGGDSNLDGPVEDAVGMMRWLTMKGMPRDRITLLASPLEKNKGKFDEFADISYRPADRETIRAVFRRELKALSGDALWVYWAGHGVQMRGNRWGLLYPSTVGDDLSGAGVDNLVTLLRTSHLPPQRVRRATVIIDACRSAQPPRKHVKATDAEDLTNETQSNFERQVFLMRASQAGVEAKNRGGSGLFTTTLLDVLERLSPVGAAIDLDAAWLAVCERFEQLRASGDTPQVPTAYRLNWDAQEDEFDPRPVPAADIGTALGSSLIRVTRAALAAPGASADRVALRLCELLGIRQPDDEGEVRANDLVSWALTRPHGVTTLRHVLSTEPGGALDDELWKTVRAEVCDRWLLGREYDELLELLLCEEESVHKLFADTARDVVGLVLDSDRPADVVDQLEAVTPAPGGLPVLLRTVEHSAALLMPQPLADALRDWSLNCAKRLGVESALEERRAAAEAAARRLASAAGPATAIVDCVQIRLSGPDADARRTYQVWTSGAFGTEMLDLDDTPKGLAAVESDLDTILSRHARPGLTRVEFFLADGDLELPVHRWRIGAGDPVDRSLGVDFDVVVRCAEYRDKNEVRWRQRWSKVGTAATRELHELSGQSWDKPKVYAELQTKENAPGVVFSGTPAADRAGVLTMCVFGGVPVVIWHGGAEQDDVREQLEQLLADRRLADVPAVLRRLRAACDTEDEHPGRHLALLWDNPERPLPRPLVLAAPATTLQVPPRRSGT
ncbi:caspase family protein [Streptomyces sp. NPDC014870]|uniref:VMAP-C domain-containing protein n=1 Tax=Streptomyces sp. NPDC014870 TaxID=3364925 RepID=UPI0036F51507